MVKILKILILVLFCLAFSLNAKELSLNFSSYPAKVVNLKKIPRRDLVVTDENKYLKSRLKKLIKKRKINFAGSYSVASIGCGTGCSFWLVVDLATGKTPKDELMTVSYCNDNSPKRFKTILSRADSRLLAIVGTSTMSSNPQCMLYYYVEDNGKIKLIKKTKWTQNNTKSLEKSINN